MKITKLLFPLSKSFSLSLHLTLSLMLWLILLAACTPQGQTPEPQTPVSNEIVDGDSTEETPSTIATNVPENATYISIGSTELPIQFTFNGDATLFAYSTLEGINIFQVDNHGLICSFKTSLGPDSIFSFSPDGNQIAVPSKDTPGVTIINTKTCDQEKVLTGDGKTLIQVYYSTDGSKIIALPGYGIFVIDANTGNLLSTYLMETNVDRPSFSPDGYHGWVYKGLFVIPSSGEHTGPLQIDTYFVNYSPPDHLIFLPNGHYITLHDFRTYDDPVQIHQDAQNYIAVENGKELGGGLPEQYLLSPDEKMLIFWKEQEVFAIDMATGEILNTYPREKPTHFIKAASIDDTGTVYIAIWDTESNGSSKIYLKPISLINN